MIDCRFDSPSTSSPGFDILQLPCVPSFVVEETWIIVAFIEVFEDGGEYFGDLFGEIDPLGGRFEELATADCCKKGR